MNLSITTTEKLNKLYERLQGCTRTQLGLESVNRPDILRGFGKPIGHGRGSRYMFIGQNPGQRRAPNSELFALGSKNGCILNSILLQAGYRLDDCYFTNLVKCSTKENEVPSSLIISRCTRSWLMKEVDLVDPPLIVAMGSACQNYFHLNSLLTPRIWNGREVVGIWHPTFAKRFNKIPEYIDQLERIHELGAKQLSFI